MLGVNASFSCIFYNSEIETLDHVLLFCPLVWRVWSHLVCWWGLYWVMPRSVEGLFLWWSSFRFPKVSRQIWRFVPLLVFWAIWKSRNECKFQGAQPTSQLESLRRQLRLRLLCGINIILQAVCILSKIWSITFTFSAILQSVVNPVVQQG